METGSSATPAPEAASSASATELSKTGPVTGGQGTPAASNQPGHSALR